MSDKQFRIIPVEVSHIEEIVQISKNCHLSDWTVDNYKDETIRKDSFNVVFKHLHSNKIIGFMFARLIKHLIFDQFEYLDNRIIDNTKSYFDAFEETEILNIAVHPKYQNRGVGQCIFDYFTNFCLEKRIKYIWLEVRESNNQAKNFYLKNGFQISYSRKNYYLNPVEDALIMKRDLTATPEKK